MPKATMFAIAAVGDLIIAFILYQGGRVILPLILGVGGLCFVVAAVGSAMKARRA
jgi:hypothetical protein